MSHSPSLAARGEHAQIRPASERPRASAWPLPRSFPLVTAAGACLLFCASAAVTARGLVPQALGGAAIAGTFVAAVAAVFDAGRRAGLWAAGERSLSRALFRRHGFWLVVAASLLYLPTLGMASLWDPWESHYGEVAREILMRHDWLSLWWSHQGFFYSKPALAIWLQAISMAVLGVNVQPGQVLAGGAHPEWAIRLPNALFAIVGLYVLYRGVAVAFGRRAGLLGGLVLATAPHWFLLAHQASTDMTFVAPMSAAMGLVLIALHTDPAATARVHELRLGKRTLSLSAWHLTVGAILVCAVPQALYLISRNVDLIVTGGGPYGFHAHKDEFLSGSGGSVNCNEPGNAACTWVGPVHAFEPYLQGLLWLAGTAGFLALVWKERRTRHLYYLGAWFFAALSTLAKGPAGFGLPVLCALLYILATRRWKLLTEMEIVSGLLVVAVVALPWYVGAYVRHGTAFTDELIFNDMINRAFSHVHDTNEGLDTSIVYYISQLGWGLFPWTALVPAGLLWWMRRSDRGGDGRTDAAVLLFAWFLFAFALFTMMGTKFHHYIFPAVPPAAMLLGVALDGWLGEHFLRRPSSTVHVVPTREDRHDARMIGAAAVAGALLLVLLGRDLALHTPGEQDGAIHFAQLFSYRYQRPWPAMLDFRAPLLAFSAAAGVAVLLLSVRAVRRYAVVGTFAVATLFAVWCGDTYLIKAGRHWGQGDVMRAYYAHRASDAEQLVAYQMNWKGENFYSGNHLAEFVSTGAPFTSWVEKEKSRGTKVLYFVCEHSRIGGLKREVSARAWEQVTSLEDSHQFALLRAQL